MTSGDLEKAFVATGQFATADDAQIAARLALDAYEAALQLKSDLDALSTVPPDADSVPIFIQSILEVEHLQHHLALLYPYLQACMTRMAGEPWEPATPRTESSD